MNLAQISELEREFEKLKRKGKKIYAWLTGAGTTQYLVACMCDKIFIADIGMIDLKSPSMRILFMKDLLDLVGIKPYAIRCGNFKGAVEPYVRSSMSKHLKEHMKGFLASINKDIISRISRWRKIPPEKVREFQEKRLFSAREALECGLVDGLTRWENAESALKRSLALDIKLKRIKLKKERKLDFSNPFKLFAQLFSSKKKEKIKKDTIVVYHMSGTITDGEKPVPGEIVSGPVEKDIMDLEKDSKVKACVIRINSPGGSGSASERILNALKKLAMKKPVVISMGNMAASGGYYITCLGKTIYAEPGTLTGSIGVFGMFFSLRPLLNRVGLNPEPVALDDAAQDGTIYNDPSERLLGEIRKYIDSFYDKFLSHVTFSRKIPRKRLLRIAGGRIWSGTQAKELGLVDRIGTLEDAISEAAAQAKLEKGKYDVKHLPYPKDPFTLLLSEFGMDEALGKLPGPAKAVILANPWLLSFLDSAIRAKARIRAWTILPFALEME